MNGVRPPRAPRFQAALLGAAVAETRAAPAGDRGLGSLLLRATLAQPDERELLAAVARLAVRRRVGGPVAAAGALWCLFLRELLGGAEPRAAWRHALARATGAGASAAGLEAAAGELLGGEDFEAGLDAIHAGAAVPALAPLASGALGVRHGLASIPARRRPPGVDHERLGRAAARLARRRHRAIYAACGAAPMRPARSLDGVFTGRNPLTDLDVEAIAGLGCRIVVDLRQAREWVGSDRAGREAVAAYGAYGVERLHLPTPDGEALADADLARALAVVEPAGRAGAPPVYVHCRAGQERTAALVLAAHARRRGLPARAALAEIQRADPRLRPLPWQVAAVERFLALPGLPPAAV